MKAHLMRISGRVECSRSFLSLVIDLCSVARNETVSRIATCNRSLE